METKDILKKLRTDANLTITDVSDATGISRPTLSRYESGTRNPKIEQLVKLSDYFDVSIAYLQNPEIYSPNDFDKNESELEGLAREIVYLVNDSREMSDLILETISDDASKIIKGAPELTDDGKKRILDILYAAETDFVYSSDESFPKYLSKISSIITNVEQALFTLPSKKERDLYYRKIGANFLEQAGTYSKWNKTITAIYDDTNAQNDSNSAYLLDIYDKLIDALALLKTSELLSDKKKLLKAKDTFDKAYKKLSNFIDHQSTN